MVSIELSLTIQVLILEIFRTSSPETFTNMSDIREEESSSGSDSSEEPTVHSLLNRPVETRAQASARQNSASSGHATASMNAFKNSTSTVATPPVPTHGIRIMPIDENTEQQEISGSSG
jgi:hypothetical protein